MNREIKFRVWDGKNMFLSPTEIGHLGSWFDAHYPGSLAEPELKSLMQFTGLKDKNGVDIYEGDKPKGFNNPIKISEINLGKDSGWDVSYKALCVNVEYDDRSGHLVLVEDGTDSYASSSNEIEIIGNIHDNLELS